MKEVFLKSLLVSFGLLFVPLTQTAEPGAFGHMGEPEQRTGIAVDQTHITENHISQEALRLEQARQAEDLQRLLTQKHPTQDPLLPHVEPGNAEGTLLPTGRDTAADDDLTTKEQLAALKREEDHSFTKASAADHHTPLEAIRTKIIQHLTNELATITSKLTAEQIKNREMVIKFFDKAGELTKENLEKFHTIYKKLAEWNRASELTLTPEEQKEMKLFLQSIISTYCSKRQSEAQ